MRDFDKHPRTVPPPSKEVFYARKGEIVTCEQGHPIFTFARDVKPTEKFDPSALTDWKQAEPQAGERPTCAVCGGQFHKGGAFHFKDGWRGAFSHIAGKLKQANDEAQD